MGLALSTGDQVFSPQVILNDRSKTHKEILKSFTDPVLGFSSSSLKEEERRAFKRLLSGDKNTVTSYVVAALNQCWSDKTWPKKSEADKAKSLREILDGNSKYWPIWKASISDSLSKVKISFNKVRLEEKQALNYVFKPGEAAQKATVYTFSSTSREKQRVQIVVQDKLPRHQFNDPQMFAEIVFALPADLKSNVVRMVLQKGDNKPRGRDGNYPTYTGMQAVHGVSGIVDVFCHNSIRRYTKAEIWFKVAHDASHVQVSRIPSGMRPLNVLERDAQSGQAIAKDKFKTPQLEGHKNSSEDSADVAAVATIDRQLIPKNFMREYRQILPGYSSLVIKDHANLPTNADALIDKQFNLGRFGPSARNAARELVKMRETPQNTPGIFIARDFICKLGLDGGFVGMSDNEQLQVLENAVKQNISKPQILSGLANTLKFNSTWSNVPSALKDVMLSSLKFIVDVPGLEAINIFYSSARSLSVLPTSVATSMATYLKTVQNSPEIIGKLAFTNSLLGSPSFLGFEADVQKEIFDANPAGEILSAFKNMILSPIFGYIDQKSEMIRIAKGKGPNSTFWSSFT